LDALDKYDFSNIHDICDIGGGTVDEYSSLLQQSGWKYVQTLQPHQHGLIEVIEGSKS
jgi:hypothetical protein